MIQVHFFALETWKLKVHLSGSNVTRLCLKAKNPILVSLLEKVGLEAYDIKTAAVCVYPSRVADAISALRFSCDDSEPIPVAAGKFASLELKEWVGERDKKQKWLFEYKEVNNRVLHAKIYLQLCFLKNLSSCL